MPVLRKGSEACSSRNFSEVFESPRLVEEAMASIRFVGTVMLHPPGSREMQWFRPGLDSIDSGLRTMRSFL